MEYDTESVELVGDHTAENVARAVVFAAVTGATASMSIHTPFSAVPVTLQTLWVLLAGIFLGPVWGGGAFGIYLLAGLVGLPVFEGGSGLGYVLGSTGGYLVGFALGAAAVGAVVHGGFGLRDPREVGVPRLAAATVVGTLVVFAAGVPWLAYVQNLSLVDAVAAGVVPFLPGAVVKAAAAIGIARSDAVVAR